MKKMYNEPEFMMVAVHTVDAITLSILSSGSGVEIGMEDDIWH